MVNNKGNHPQIALFQVNEILTFNQNIYIYYILVAGIPTPLKNDGVKVSWDDDIPN